MRGGETFSNFSKAPEWLNKLIWNSVGPGTPRVTCFWKVSPLSAPVFSTAFSHVLCCSADSSKDKPQRKATIRKDKPQKKKQVFGQEDAIEVGPANPLQNESPALKSCSLFVVSVPIPSCSSLVLQPPKTPQVLAPENFQHFSFSDLLQHQLQTCLSDLPPACLSLQMAARHKETSRTALGNRYSVKLPPPRFVGQPQPVFWNSQKAGVENLRATKRHTDTTSPHFWCSSSVMPYCVVPPALRNLAVTAILLSDMSFSHASLPRAWCGAFSPVLLTSANASRKT